MKLASSDRLADLAFTVCCLALLGVAAGRYWPRETGVQAREAFLERGTPDPFGLPASADTDGPLLCVFVSANCPACSDSLPFYTRLEAGVARSPGRTRLIFLSMEPQDAVDAYLRRGGLSNPRVASVRYPAGVPGTPCILMLDDAHRVDRSWAGRLSARQERDVEALLLR